MAKYETPNHHDIHKLGIKPDLEVPLEAITLNDVGTSADRQYQAAVQLLSSKSVLAEAVRN